MIASLPVSVVFDDGTPYVGSAFLAQKGSAVYLVTAAHLFDPPTPTNRFESWPRSLNIYFTDGQVKVPIFDHSDSPKFGYFHDEGSEKLADVWWMPLASMGSAPVARVLSQYAVHALPSSITPVVDSPLRLCGYSGSARPWPGSIQAEEGALIRVDEGPMVRGSYQSAGGFSGGPVLGGNGELVGLHIGHHPKPTDPSSIVPAPLIDYLIDRFAGKLQSTV